MITKEYLDTLITEACDQVDYADGLINEGEIGNLGYREKVALLWETLRSLRATLDDCDLFGVLATVEDSVEQERKMNR